MGTGWRRARIALGLTVCATAERSRPVSGEDSSESVTPSVRSHSVSTATTPRSEGRTPRPLILQKSACGVCFKPMRCGEGCAIFTAECSHAFHFHCVASHVRRGSASCPVCFAAWKDAPFLSAAAPRRSEPEPRTPPGREEVEPVPAPKSRLYDDDEPLLSVGAAPCRRFNPIPEEESSPDVSGICSNRTVVNLTIVPEFPALIPGKSYDDFAMLLRVAAPATSSGSSGHDTPRKRLSDQNSRPPIDVVVVIDARSALRTMKRAFRVVASSLSSGDRLAVVAFTRGSSKRLLPLMRMSVHGQRAARRLVERLEVSSNDDAESGDSVGALADGVKKAAKMLSDRRERNPASGILLLTDDATACRRRAPKLSALFGTLGLPVHTFGFTGEPVAQAGGPVTFSDGTGNTFSYVHDEASFRQCVGTLLSVAIQDLHLEIECASESGGLQVKLSSLYASVQRSRIHAGRRSGSIQIGDLYAEEEREFLVELKIPATKAVGPASLISVRCSFVDPLTQETVNGEARTLTLPVVESVRGFPNSVGMKVERLRNRLRTTRAISEARHLVEKGDASASRLVLAAARTRLLGSASLSADEHVRAIDAELAELGSKRGRFGSDIGLKRTELEAPSPGSVLDMAMRLQMESNGDPLTPRSAWREAERLARVAMMRKAMNRADDLHGLEDARF
ncbi:E3 ubiquitin-protein ligase WAV3-like [Nymphaea colorata]|nr:E3 ubiquitin-protein ligase WAV3-like [Nymphaea colorata]